MVGLYWWGTRSGRLWLYLLFVVFLAAVAFLPRLGNWDFLRWGGALAIAWLVHWVFSRQVFLLIFPDRLALWWRFRVFRRLMCEWECTWPEVESLREYSWGRRPPEDLGRRELLVRCPKGTFALYSHGFQRPQDWSLLKQRLVERAGLRQGEEVRERTWWGKEEYVLHSRQGSNRDGDEGAARRAV